jgi:hypothetical protein
VSTVEKKELCTDVLNDSNSPDEDTAKFENNKPSVMEFKIQIKQCRDIVMGNTGVIKIIIDNTCSPHDH